MAIHVGVVTAPAYSRVGGIVRLLGLTPSVWRKFAREGHVRCVYIKGQRVFDVEDCRRFLSGEKPATRPMTGKEAHRLFILRREAARAAD